MIDFLTKIFCKHDYKFDVGQRVYMTKCDYWQKCTKCNKIKRWSADIMAIDFENELKRTGQEIHDSEITNAVRKKYR